MIGYLIGLIAVVALVLSIICMTRCKTNKFGDNQLKKFFNPKLSCKQQAPGINKHWDEYKVDKLYGTCRGHYVKSEDNPNFSCVNDKINVMKVPLVATNLKNPRWNGKYQDDARYSYDCEMTFNPKLDENEYCNDSNQPYNTILLKNKFTKNVNLSGNCIGQVFKDNPDFKNEGQMKKLGKKSCNKFDIPQLDNNLEAHIPYKIVPYDTGPFFPRNSMLCKYSENK